MHPILSWFPSSLTSRALLGLAAVACCGDDECFHLDRNKPYALTFKKGVRDPNLPPCLRPDVDMRPDILEGDTLVLRVTGVREHPNGCCTNPGRTVIDTPELRGGLTLSDCGGASGGPEPEAIWPEVLLTTCSTSVGVDHTWTLSLRSATQPGDAELLGTYREGAPAVYAVRWIKDQANNKCGDAWEAELRPFEE